MIWAGGRVVPEGVLSVPVDDRTFEHGLGLFETLRTWNGRATLLDRHLDRMLGSAKALGIHLNRATLPDGRAVADLRAAEGWDGDRMLRITASGGGPGSWPMAWMRSASLPPEPPPEGWSILLNGWTVDPDDPTARHKMLNYWSRRDAHERARAAGCDEALSRTPDGRLWEGSRTSLFAVAGGTILVPSLNGPIVPGVLRGVVLERAAGWSGGVREVEGITPDELVGADEVFLANAVRGVIPVRLAGAMYWDAPGPATAWFRDQVIAACLTEEGESS